MGIYSILGPHGWGSILSWVLTGGVLFCPGSSRVGIYSILGPHGWDLFCPGSSRVGFYSVLGPHGWGPILSWVLCGQKGTYNRESKSCVCTLLQWIFYRQGIFYNMPSRTERVGHVKDNIAYPYTFSFYSVHMIIIRTLLTGVYGRFSRKSDNWVK